MAASKIKLTGIIWNHIPGLSAHDGYSPALQQAHPDVEIEWDARTLQQFADQPLDELVWDYDLFIIDHPWAGYVAETEILVPLDEHLPGYFLEEQSANSVGASYPIYAYGGNQWGGDAASRVPPPPPNHVGSAGPGRPRPDSVARYPDRYPDEFLHALYCLW